MFLDLAKIRRSDGGWADGSERSAAAGLLRMGPLAARDARTEVLDEADEVKW